MRRKNKSKFWEYTESIIIAVILALFIRAFVVQAFKIPSGSMEPTLLIGDHILVNKFIYGIKIPFTPLKLFPFKKPERGEVIVFTYPVDPSKDFIKRVIAVGGDTIRIVDKKVFLNGKPYPDSHGFYVEGFSSYPSSNPGDNYGPLRIPQDSLFVMGDNRDRSYDSRFWGLVKLNQVKGKALIIYWSWNRDSHWVRWKRISHLIH